MRSNPGPRPVGRTFGVPGTEAAGTGAPGFGAPGTVAGTAALRAPASAAVWPVLAAGLRALTGDVRVVVVRLGSLLDDARTPSDPRAPGARERVLVELARPDLVSVAVATEPVHDDGLAVALGCDLRLLTPTVDVTVGGDAVFGSLGRLADLIGQARALEWCLTRRRVTAAEAQAVGLANLVVSDGEMDAAVDDLVEALLAVPREAATRVKALLAARERVARDRRVAAGFAAARLPDDGAS